MMGGKKLIIGHTSADETNDWSDVIVSFLVSWQSKASIGSVNITQATHFTAHWPLPVYSFKTPNSVICLIPISNPAKTRDTTNNFIFHNFNTKLHNEIKIDTIAMHAVFTIVVTRNSPVWFYDTHKYTRWTNLIHFFATD